MNKTVKSLLVVIGILFFLYSIVTQTGMLRGYINASFSNEPNLKLDSKIYTSNLVHPKIGDFVCYNYEDEMFGKHTRIHRLCAMENDVLEIVNGEVFLNNISIDKELKLLHFYQFPNDQLETIKEDEKISDDSVHFFILRFDSGYFALLDASKAKKYGISSKRKIDEKGKIDDRIKSVFKENWNKDHFGPLIIPQGQIFVLGDNRDNSDDSRYIGLIKKSDIVGTMVFK